MDDTIDALQIKIEEARKQLPEETRRAIDAVPWKESLIGLRESKGFTVEQMGNLETETELLLCGLVSPKDYQKELEMQMGLPGAKVYELVNDMNRLVFNKIREEMMKNIEKQNTVTTEQPKATPTAQINPVRSREGSQRPSASNGINKDEMQILDKAGIKIVDTPINTDIKQTAPLEIKTTPVKQPAPDLTVPELNAAPTILSQKFSGAFKMSASKTEHVLDNMNAGVVTTPPPPKAPYPKGADPYRLPPE